MGTRVLLFLAGVMVLFIAGVYDVSAAGGLYTYRLQSFSPTQSGKDHIIVGNYVYSINAEQLDTTKVSLDVFDLSSPAAPIKVATVYNTAFSGGVWGAFWGRVVAVGNHLYVLWSSNEQTLLSVYDISNRANPVLLGQTKNIGTYAHHIAAYGSVLYVSDQNGLTILNAANPLSITPFNTLGSKHRFSAVTVHGGYLYAAEYLGGGSYLSIYSLSNPYSPVYLGHIRTAPPNGALTGITVVGNKAYVALTANTDEFQIFDVSNKFAPIRQGSFDIDTFWWASNMNAYEIAVDYPYAYVPYDGPLEIFDITDPNNPTIAARVSYPCGGFAGAGLLFSNYVIVGGGCAYILTTPPQPNVTSLITPTVSGALRMGQTVTFTGQVYMNSGSSITTDFTDDFSYRWNSPGPPWTNIGVPTSESAPFTIGEVRTDQSVGLPLTTSGWLYVRHRVDSQDQITESNETAADNSKIASFLVSVAPACEPVAVAGNFTVDPSSLGISLCSSGVAGPVDGSSGTNWDWECRLGGDTEYCSAARTQLIPQ